MMIHDCESKTYNVAELIRDYAKGNKEVQAYCSQPKQDRLFNSPIEPERLNQQKIVIPKQEAPQKIEEKQEQQQTQQESEGGGEDNFVSLFSNVFSMTSPYYSSRMGTCLFLDLLGHAISVDCLMIAFFVITVPLPDRPA